MDAVIRAYDAAGNVIETYEHAGQFKRVKHGHYEIKLAANSCIALWSSKKRGEFLISAHDRNAFRRRDVRPQSRSFARLNQ